MPSVSGRSHHAQLQDLQRPEWKSPFPPATWCLPSPTASPPGHSARIVLLLLYNLERVCVRSGQPGRAVDNLAKIPSHYFWVSLFWGHICLCSGLAPCSMHMDHSRRNSGDHMQCRRWKPVSFVQDQCLPSCDTALVSRNAF